MYVDACHCGGGTSSDEGAAGFYIFCQKCGRHGAEKTIFWDAVSSWNESLRSSMQLHLGDCLDILPTIPDKSVDMVLADLPYGTTRNKWDCPIDLQRLWPEYLRICKGPIVLTAQTPFDKVLGASNLPMLKYEWIWEKTNATGHMNAKKCPMKAHENVLVFYKSLRVYNPQKTFGHARKVSVADRERLQSDNYGRQAGVTSYDSTERYPRSVITFPSDKQKLKLHPTQKPLDLMRYLIRTYTNEGDVVLDNCFGSATTGVACLELGRGFIGMESDPMHFETGRDRILVRSGMIAARETK